jgi:tripartite-type tricarboxylate transporter receptor subunit TctC
MISRLSRLSLCAIAGAVSLAFTAPAAAQKFPTKPVRLVIGFAPGGGTDTTARALSSKLAASLGEQVVVDNRPGHSGTIAAVIVA